MLWTIDVEALTRGKTAPSGISRLWKSRHHRTPTSDLLLHMALSIAPGELVSISLVFAICSLLACCNSAVRDWIEVGSFELKTCLRTKSEIRLQPRESMVSLHCTATCAGCKLVCGSCVWGVELQSRSTRRSTEAPRWKHAKDRLARDASTMRMRSPLRRVESGTGDSSRAMWNCTE